MNLTEIKTKLNVLWKNRDENRGIFSTQAEQDKSILNTSKITTDNPPKEKEQGKDAIFLQQQSFGKKEVTITRQRVAHQYQRYPSFSQFLPWSEWSENNRAMLLEDGLSVGCALELRDVAMEAAPIESIQALHQKLAATLSRVVPLEDDNPWVIQFFVQDEVSLQSLEKKLQHYIPKQHQHKKLTQHYLQIMSSHFAALTREQGLFDDPLTGTVFRGKTRRIRLVLYRRYTQTKKSPQQSTLDELNQVCDALIANLQAFGMKVRRLQGKQLYDWWVRWFNPKPATTDGKVDTLLQRFPYPAEDKKPHGWSLTQHVFFNEPCSTSKGWEFDGIKHNLLLFRELNASPDIGIISRERTIGDSKYSLLDKFPEGSIYTLQITFESKRTLEKHLEKIANSAVGKGDAPKQVKANVNRAYSEIHNGNLLCRVVQGLYYRAEDAASLEKTERHVMALLSHAGLAVVHPDNEMNRLDNYLRFLPFNFNPAFDKKYLYRSAYQYATDVAALLPIYGRSRGDGQHPLNIFYNRGGEGFIFDHLNPHFKMANSHMAIIGSTGAGKSVFLNSMIMQLLAVKNARVFVIEAGGSFDLLARYVKQYDVTVNHLKFNRMHPIAMNPFAESYQALALIEQEEAAFQALHHNLMISDAVHDKLIAKHANKLQQEEKTSRQVATEDEQTCDENRDILSEMALAIRVMVTGGLEKEEERFTLSDDMLIVETLIHTIKTCKVQRIPQVLTSHVIEGFEKAANQATLPDVAKRLNEMARAMAGFIKNPIKARFFNRPSDALQETDLTVIDLGFLQEKQNASMMSLVFISLLAKILALAEKQQYSDRPTVLVIDEAHIPLKNPLVALYLVLMAKVARKIGLWLMPTTQNVEDFSSEESKKMLSMMETLICLAVGNKEIEHIKQFRSLSEDEEALLRDIRKYPGLYSEGVLLGARFKGLFRNVPPRIFLSLAMTEQTEKAERHALMNQYHVDELAAAELVAETLLNKKQVIKEDAGFDD